MNNNMSERDMLDQLLQVEPNNRFYRSLHEQYQKHHRLTPRQTECLLQDYQKKLGHLVTNNMDRVEVKTSEKHTPTPSPTPDKDVASATTNNNPHSGDVLVDHRKRTLAQLETVFGKLNRFKAMYLYNDSKISMKEYKSVLEQSKEKKI